ncbi:acyltransferase [Saccharicrinis aurantiacus]|uniref:acyltransferase n=1 Tax=Saccharicrinis aurantiacus TaxID=1849719 RepID=UPI0024935B82|nr:acyltransferase [Saccharicrinis aurantiacus]
MPFLTEKQLSQIGFKCYGENVLISDKASIYSPETISIGNHVRIDDFCILSGNITLGNYIHISAYSALYGKMGIIMEDYTGLSPRCTIFSASDDFSGEYMISPMVPTQYTNVQGGTITLQQFAQAGANTVILPNVTLHQGAVTGALSLVKSNIPEWEIHGGTPCKFIKTRKKDLLKHLTGY